MTIYREVFKLSVELLLSFRAKFRASYHGIRYTYVMKLCELTYFHLCFINKYQFLVEC
jgi:hypothetical protein